MVRFPCLDVMHFNSPFLACTRLGSLSALESFGEQLRVLNLKDTWVDVVGERGSLGGLRGLLRLEQLSLGSSQCPVGFRKPRGRQGRASTTASSSSGQQQLSPQPQQQGSALSSSSQSVNGEAASLADADVYDDAFFDAWVRALPGLHTYTMKFRTRYCETFVKRDTST